MRVNFHTHSNVSDGLSTPKELIKKLNDDEVKICALTDHDRIAGLEAAKKTANELGIIFVNGIEISCNLHDIEIDSIKRTDYSVHMLGLNFNLEDIKQIYEKRKLDKIQRINKLVFTLKNNGYNIDIPFSTERKTTIADALVNNGYANNTQDAFNNIINNYYDKYTDKMSVKEAIEIVHQAGGKIIWAHHFDILNNFMKIRIDNFLVEKICSQFKKLGTDGIEVFYEPFTKKHINFLIKMQKKYDFIASFGTDYHGKDDQLKTYLDINEKLVEELMS